MTRYRQYGRHERLLELPRRFLPRAVSYTASAAITTAWKSSQNYLLKLIPNVSIIQPRSARLRADRPSRTKLPRSADTQGEDNINAYVAWLNDFVEHTLTPARMQPLPLHLVGHSFISIVTSAFPAARPARSRSPRSSTRLTPTRPRRQPALRLPPHLSSTTVPARHSRKNRPPLLRSQLIYCASRRSYDAHQRDRQCAASSTASTPPTSVPSVPAAGAPAPTKRPLRTPQPNTPPQSGYRFRCCRRRRPVRCPGSRHVRDAYLPRPARLFVRRPRAPGHDSRVGQPHPLRTPRRAAELIAISPPNAEERTEGTITKLMVDARYTRIGYDGISRYTPLPVGRAQNPHRHR